MKLIIRKNKKFNIHITNDPFDNNDGYIVSRSYGTLECIDDLARSGHKELQFIIDNINEISAQTQEDNYVYKWSTVEYCRRMSKEQIDEAHNLVDKENPNALELFVLICIANYNEDTKQYIRNYSYLIEHNINTTVLFTLELERIRCKDYPLPATTLFNKIGQLYLNRRNLEKYTEDYLYDILLELRSHPVTYNALYQHIDNVTPEIHELLTELKYYIEDTIDITKRFEKYKSTAFEERAIFEITHREGTDELIDYIRRITSDPRPIVETHPTLKKICGRYNSHQIAPPWWNTFKALAIKDIRTEKKDYVKAIFKVMSDKPELIEQGRTRENGPKLLKVLRKATRKEINAEQSDWWKMFNLKRGKNDSELEFVITDRGLTKIGMSLWTYHWTNCMHLFTGGRRTSVFNMLIDGEVAIMYATDKRVVKYYNAEHENMVARALIRVVYDYNTNEEAGILLDQIYCDGERAIWRMIDVIKQIAKKHNLKVYRKPNANSRSDKIRTVYANIKKYNRYVKPAYMDTLQDVDEHNLIASGIVEEI